VFAQTGDLGQLSKINTQFVQNFMNNDTVAHTRIIHPDFVCITSKGKALTRQQYMHDWLHGSDGFSYFDIRNERIRVFGSYALITAVNKYVAVVGGKTVTGMSVYTDTYVKENGTWRCVQAQMNTVSTENYPADETIKQKFTSSMHGKGLAEKDKSE
jgi:hypothetical protein